MAAELYNKMTGTHDADSAGTEVLHPNKTLQERRDRRGGTYVIDVMEQEEGIDVRQNVRTQITKDMLDKYDVVISMAQPEYTPKWLSENQKYTYWPVADPGGKSFEATVQAKKDITERLQKLLAS